MKRLKMISVGETDSTNRWLRDYGGTEDMIVTTDYQTAGRGCGGNHWESERGSNLLFSLLLHPAALSADRAFVISQAVSVALCDVLTEYANGFTIKWPNDIYWQNRKICGMLIENRLHGSMITDCIIGIGINVNQQVFTSDAPNPVSLCQITGAEVDRAVLLSRFLARLASAIDEPLIGEAYSRRLYRRSLTASYRDADGEFEAVLDGVAPDGRLMLTDRSGRQRLYAFKEVAFVI